MKFIDFETGEYNAEICIDIAEELLDVIQKEIDNKESNDDFIDRLFVERLDKYTNDSNEEFDKIVSKINSIVIDGNYTNLEMMRYLRRLDNLSIKSTKTFMNLIKFLMKGDN